MKSVIVKRKSTTKYVYERIKNRAIYGQHGKNRIIELVAEEGEVDKKEKNMQHLRTTESGFFYGQKREVSQEHKKKWNKRIELDIKLLEVSKTGTYRQKISNFHVYDLRKR